MGSARSPCAATAGESVKFSPLSEETADEMFAELTAILGSLKHPAARARDRDAG